MDKLEKASVEHRKLAVQREFLREAMISRQFGVNSRKRYEYDRLYAIDCELKYRQEKIQQDFIDDDSLMDTNT